MAIAKPSALHFQSKFGIWPINVPFPCHILYFLHRRKTRSLGKMARIFTTLCNMWGTIWRNDLFDQPILPPKIPGRTLREVAFSWFYLPHLYFGYRSVVISSGTVACILSMNARY